MTTIKYDRNATVAAALPTRYVKLNDEQSLSIPAYLTDRVCRKELNSMELGSLHYPRAARSFGLFEASRFETVEGTFVPNGNDVILAGNTIIEFSPLVKTATSLDTTYLVDANCAVIDGSPMIDNLWLDEAAEREYNEMLKFINSVNA